MAGLRSFCVSSRDAIADLRQRATITPSLRARVRGRLLDTGLDPSGLEHDGARAVRRCRPRDTEAGQLCS